MPSSDPIFVHPLLGADDAWSGYRIEFAPGHASPEALARLRSSPLRSEFDQRHLWFLPALPGTSAADQVMPHSVTVFSPRANAEDSEALTALEAELRQTSHKVGLATSPEDKLPASGTWDYLLIGASHARSLPPYTLLGQASRTIVVATDVHTHNDRDWVLNNACTLSTGEFLLTRPTANNKPDITRLKLLKLLSLICEDADTGALDAIFREEQKLSYSLLRLVNSAAISPPSPITSFTQAINLLGRRQLQRWLQLLVYSDPNNGQQPNPLLQKAAARGRLLELLAARLPQSELTENLDETAFMVGTFSLLDVLLSMPMPEILHQLPLPDVAGKALGTHEGSLGHLLGVIDAADKRDLTTAAQRLKGLGMDGDTYLDAQLEAFSWAGKIRPAA
jgi:EAL and modified HD-GYP domain-containing signal transduction protein